MKKKNDNSNNNSNSSNDKNSLSSYPEELRKLLHDPQGDKRHDAYLADPLVEAAVFAVVTAALEPVRVAPARGEREKESYVMYITRTEFDKVGLYCFNNTKEHHHHHHHHHQQQQQQQLVAFYNLSPLQQFIKSSPLTCLAA